MSNETENDSPAEDAPAPDPGAHPAGVRRIAALFVSLAVLAALPYVLPVPGIEELRAWRQGSDIPFTGLFEFTPPTRSRIAGIERRRSKMEQDDEELLAKAPLPKSEQPPPERVGAGYRTPAQVSKRNEKLRIDPSEYEGMTLPVVDPQDAMHAFYEQLADVARQRPDTLARMFMYSDSVNGADRISSTLRHKLQDRFGDGGKGWVPVAPGWSYQKHQDVEWETERRWDTWVVNRGNGPGDRYGYGGVLAQSFTPNAAAIFATTDGEPAGTKVSTYRFYYQAWPEGADALISVDGGEPERLSTKADAPEDRVHEIDVSDGPHSLRIESDGRKLRGYGVVMERDGPGVVVDGLALIGAFARVLRNWDVEHWTHQLRTRDPELMVFWLGGNDSTSDSVPFVHDELVEQYGTVIERAKRALPDAGCLVMAPMDAGEKKHGRIRTMSRVPRVVAATEDVAEAQDCAFFNTFEAVGGHNTMHRWYHNSPRLAASDYHHLTEAGARVVGTLLYKAILKDYDDWLTRPGE